MMNCHTNFPVTKYYRQQLSNTFSKIDEDTFNLHIETSHSIVLDVKIDAAHIDQIMKLSWSPWKSNRSQKYYVLHGGTRTKENDPPVYLHQYVMQLNNSHPPRNNNVDTTIVDASIVDTCSASDNSQIEFSVDTCSASDNSQIEFSVDACSASENNKPPLNVGGSFSVDTCSASDNSQIEFSVDTCSASDSLIPSGTTFSVDACSASENNKPPLNVGGSFSVDTCSASDNSQIEFSVDTCSASDSLIPSGTTFSVDACSASENNKPPLNVGGSFSVDTCSASDNLIPSGIRLSVDHINRDPLDNRIQNLRWATQSEQNQNTDKRKRQCTARELPKGIQQPDIPKWVNYNVETIVQSSGQSYNRCFFRIEKHPRLSKWTSTKSVEVTPQEKLAQTYHYMMKMGESFEFIPEYIQTIIDKKKFDDDTLMEENGFILKRSMIPKYVNFVKATERRGCKFEIAIPSTKRISTKGAKSITLEEKFNEMMMKLI